MLNEPQPIPGMLFAISAPSGAGKTTLVSALLEQLPALKVSISHTTRAPRQAEVDGKNYFFVSEEKFKLYQSQGIFLESAKVFNHWYGTSKQWVLEQQQAGFDIIFDIDWQGAQKIKEQMDCVSIFLLPPSREALSARLQNRRQDSAEVIAQRMALASQEVSHYNEYDYVVINNVFETALADLLTIIRAQKLKTQVQQTRYRTLLASLTSNTEI